MGRKPKERRELDWVEIQGEMDRTMKTIAIRHLYPNEVKRVLKEMRKVFSFRIDKEE